MIGLMALQVYQPALSTVYAARRSKNLEITITTTITPTLFLSTALFQLSAHLLRNTVALI